MTILICWISFNKDAWQCTAHCLAHQVCPQGTLCSRHITHKRLCRTTQAENTHRKGQTNTKSAVDVATGALSSLSSVLLALAPLQIFAEGSAPVDLWWPVTQIFRVKSAVPLLAAPATLPRHRSHLALALRMSVRLHVLPNWIWQGSGAGLGTSSRRN